MVSWHGTEMSGESGKRGNLSPHFLNFRQQVQTFTDTWKLPASFSELSPTSPDFHRYVETFRLIFRRFLNMFKHCREREDVGPILALSTVSRHESTHSRRNLGPRIPLHP